MAKKKSTKVDKATRKVIESISDLIKWKDHQYKFKGVKKKQVKRIKKTCAHWILRKGRIYPSVEPDPANPDNWKCNICGKSFPMELMNINDYNKLCLEFESIVNQAFFYSVKMGGSIEDTKVFLQLKELLPTFQKIVVAEVKHILKNQEAEDRKTNSDTLSQFGNYSSYQYNIK